MKYKIVGKYSPTHDQVVFHAYIKAGLFSWNRITRTYSFSEEACVEKLDKYIEVRKKMLQKPTVKYIERSF